MCIKSLICSFGAHAISFIENNGVWKKLDNWGESLATEISESDSVITVKDSLMVIGIAYELSGGKGNVELQYSDLDTLPNLPISNENGKKPEPAANAWWGGALVAMAQTWDASWKFVADTFVNDDMDEDDDTDEDEGIFF